MTEKERKLQDLLDGYNTAKKALEDEADEPVKKARKEQNDRISGKAKENTRNAGILPSELENQPKTEKVRNDANDVDPIAAARAEQLARITSNR